jgi:SNF2 family DNA or RNA helicase
LRAQEDGVTVDRNELDIFSTDGDIVMAKQYTSKAAALTDMRRVCNNLALFSDEFPAHKSPKDELILDLLDSTAGQGQKVILFCWHRDYANYLSQMLAATKKWPHVLVTGKTPKRAQVVEQFKTDPDVSVLIATIAAAGTGLNIPQAQAAIFAESDWTPANNLQAEDRVHRLVGTRVSPTIYRLAARNTIEAHILDLIESKSDMADAVLAIREVLQRILASRQAAFEITA